MNPNLHPQATPALPPASTGHVLLAEHDVVRRCRLSALLAEAGLLVTLATDGHQAVEFALGRDVDLVLMSARLPSMDGTEAAALLRAAGFARPVLALADGPADSALCRDARCDEVLPASTPHHALLAAVARHLAARRSRAGDSPEDTVWAAELQALRDEFAAGLPQQVRSIEAALRQGDWDQLAHVAHTLKGSAGSYGHAGLTAAAAAVETQLLAGRPEAAAGLCKSLLAEAALALQR